MKYKVVAIDMDGTLLNSKHEISQNNKNMLKVATEKGVQVIISTGRIFTSARYFAKLLGLITPVIACNGAYVSEYHKDLILYESAIKKEDTIKVIEILDKYDIVYRFYDNDNFYLKNIKSMSDKYSEWTQSAEDIFKVKLTILDSPVDFVKDNSPKVYKFVIADEDAQKLSKVKEEILQIEGIEVVSSWMNSFDIMNKGVSKGNALKELCEKLGVKSEEVIAIGDNFNDSSMIEYAGMGVAMGNAEDGVKEIADMVTDTNDNDGVAKALKELIG